MPDDYSQPIEGEIVSPTPSTDPAARIADLTNLINNYLSRIDSHKKEADKYKEMLDSIYENDPTYQQHDLAVREATKIRSATKKQLQKLPQVADMMNKVQDAKTQIKELRNDLSGYLQDYQRLTNSTTFESEDGEVRQIVYSAKLVRKSDFQP